MTYALITIFGQLEITNALRILQRAVMLKWTVIIYFLVGMRSSIKNNLRLGKTTILLFLFQSLRVFFPSHLLSFWLSFEPAIRTVALVISVELAQETSAQMSTKMN